MEALPILNERYQLTASIGRGGMAHIYAAHDLTLDRPVAIKVLKQSLSADPAFRERFHHEARAAANLSHPNIVTIHDFGLDKGHLFIVMEHVPGSDMKALIQQQGRLPVEQALPLIIQTCSGIGYAHRAGIIHCDIKPQNLLITPDLRLKITDFGIARALASITPDEHHQEVWGSPQYFSPEQASGTAPLPASDVYSLGVVIYELLTGHLPFIAQSAQEYAGMHLHTAPPNPSAVNPEISPALEAIILKVLSKAPSQRYRTADQLGRVLQTYFQPAVFNPISSQLVDPGNLEPIASPPNQHVEDSTAVIDQLNAVDWVTIGLGLLTLAAVGGLIPLWLAVLFQIL